MHFSPCSYHGCLYSLASLHFNITQFCVPMLEVQINYSLFIFETRKGVAHRFIKREGQLVTASLPEGKPHTTSTSSTPSLLIKTTREFRPFHFYNSTCPSYLYKPSILFVPLISEHKPSLIDNQDDMTVLPFANLLACPLVRLGCHGDNHMYGSA